MLTLTTGFAAIFIDVGLGSAIIQKGQLTQTEIDTAFWMSLAVGISLAVSLACAAGSIASFFDQQQLVHLIELACLGLPFTGLAIVPNAVLVRRLEIRSVELTTLFGTTTGVSCSHWWLHSSRPGQFPVIGPLIATVLTSVVLFAISQVRAALRFRVAALRSLRPVASFQAAFNIVNFWTRNVDNLLVGISGHCATCVLQSRLHINAAPDVCNEPPVAKTLTSVLARLQDDVPRSKRIFEGGTIYRIYLIPIDGWTMSRRRSAYPDPSTARIWIPRSRCSRFSPWQRFSKALRQPVAGYSSRRVEQI